MGGILPYEPVAGFDVAVHRALTEPILLGGAPRAVAIANGTLAAAVGLGLRLWIPGLIIWAIGQLRSLTRMQLVRTLASWRPDLTAYRDLDSAYRIGLKSLARRYLELHDEIADSRCDDRRHRRRAGGEPHRPQFDWPHWSCAASPYGRRQSRKVEVRGQLRIAVRRQSGSGVVWEDRQASAQPRRRSRRQ